MLSKSIAILRLYFWIVVFICRSGFRTEERNVENRKTRCTKVNVNFHIPNEILILQLHNLCYEITAHGISLTSSHVTTTVWLSDRHLSLLSRCYSRQRQSPGRVQSRSLCQHGRPADALPTGRTTSLSWHDTPAHEHHINTSHFHGQWPTCGKVVSDMWAGWKCTGELPLLWVTCTLTQTCWPRAAVRRAERPCVRDVCDVCWLLGGWSGSALSPQSTFHLGGEGQAARHEKVRPHLIRCRMCTRPGRCAVCLTLVQIWRPN